MKVSDWGIFGYKSVIGMRLLGGSLMEVSRMQVRDSDILGWQFKRFFDLLGLGEYLGCT